MTGVSYIRSYVQCALKLVGNILNKRQWTKDKKFALINMMNKEEIFYGK